SDEPVDLFHIGVRKPQHRVHDPDVRRHSHVASFPQGSAVGRRCRMCSLWLRLILDSSYSLSNSRFSAGRRPAGGRGGHVEGPTKGMGTFMRGTVLEADEPTGASLSAKQAARRQRIVDAAMAMLEEREFERIQVKDIADGASVALGTVYHYFSSKEHLFGEVLVQWAGSLRTSITHRS